MSDHTHLHPAYATWVAWGIERAQWWANNETEGEA